MAGMEGAIPMFEKTPEQKMSDLEKNLGFVETEEMAALRKEYIEQPSQRMRVIQLWMDLAEGRIGNAQNPIEGSNEIIGMNLSFARILLEAGERESFRERLEELLSDPYESMSEAMKLTLEQILEKA